jgi:hypothetical protein
MRLLLASASPPPLPSSAPLSLAPSAVAPSPDVTAPMRKRGTPSASTYRLPPFSVTGVTGLSPCLPCPSRPKTPVNQASVTGVTDFSRCRLPAALTLRRPPAAVPRRPSSVILLIIRCIRCTRLYILYKLYPARQLALPLALSAFILHTSAFHGEALHALQLLSPDCHTSIPPYLHTPSHRLTPSIPRLSPSHATLVLGARLAPGALPGPFSQPIRAARLAMTFLLRPPSSHLQPPPSVFRRPSPPCHRPITGR